MKKIIAAIFISSIFLTGCGENHKVEEVKHPVISGVQIQTITPSISDQFYETSATVKSTTSTIVSSMIMGKITSLRVKEGDRVRAGQLLLTIDSSDIAQKALGAQAGINEAMKAVEAADQNRNLVNKTYQRYKNLYNEKVMTRQEFDTISTQKRVADIEYQRTLEGVKRAQAGLGEVAVYQGYSRITAPISGIVVAKNADLGNIAAPSQPLLTIEKDSAIEIEADINESLINRISAGTPVYLESDGTTIQSTITRIIPKVDPTTRTFKAKIAISGLKSGQYVKVKIPVGSKTALYVPQNAVVQKGQLAGVYAVDDKNIVSYRLIRTGKQIGSQFEVLSGLNSGDKIITSGVERVVDGGEVR